MEPPEERTASRPHNGGCWRAWISSKRSSRGGSFKYRRGSAPRYEKRQGSLPKLLCAKELCQRETPPIWRRDPVPRSVPSSQRGGNTPESLAVNQGKSAGKNAPRNQQANRKLFNALGTVLNEGSGEGHRSSGLREDKTRGSGRL